jgi:hypothetical protein
MSFNYFFLIKKVEDVINYLFYWFFHNDAENHGAINSEWFHLRGWSLRVRKNALWSIRI